uniref:Protein containing DUF427 n=1 Tax=uncultured bacterium ws172H5 TaxID=1131829 RepID=I1X4X3_9BACT|nr:protein containing DUF427 [uncultured bacterium ws172H5]
MITYMKASWNNQIIADSNDWVELEGNIYFPLSSVKQQYLVPSATTTVCPWKGVAHYYDVVVGDNTNKDAAWYYPEPKAAAENIKNYVAFWRGIEVMD